MENKKKPLVRKTTKDSATDDAAARAVDKIMFMMDEAIKEMMTASSEAEKAVMQASQRAFDAAKRAEEAGLAGHLAALQAIAALKQVKAEVGEEAKTSDTPGRSKTRRKRNQAG